MAESANPRFGATLLSLLEHVGRVGVDGVDGDCRQGHERVEHCHRRDMLFCRERPNTFYVSVFRPKWQNSVFWHFFGNFSLPNFGNFGQMYSACALK